MYYVYILKSMKNNFLYIGYTSNLTERIKQHEAGFTFTTHRLRPMKLVYYEAYLSKSDAIEREKHLKHYGAALGHLRNRIIGSLKLC